MFIMLVVILACILVDTSLSMTTASEPRSLSKPRTSSQSYFLKQIQSQLCRNNQDISTTITPANSDYFLLQFIFRQVQIDNLDQYRVDYQYRLNMPFKIYIAIVILIFFFVFALFSKYLSKAKRRISHNIAQMANFKYGNWELSNRHKYTYLIMFSLIFSMFCLAIHKQNQVEHALEQTICTIFGSDSKEVGYNILTRQGEQVSPFHEDILDQQSKFMMIIEKTERNIRSRQFFQIKDNLQKTAQIMRSRKKILHIQQIVMSIQKNLKRVSLITDKIVQLINYLRQNIMINRIKLVNIIRLINSNIRIKEIPKSASEFVQLIICLTALGSCILFLSLWAFFKKGQQNYLKSLKASLFLLGLIIFFVLTFTVLLYAIDVLLSMGCGLKSDLSNPKEYQKYIEDKTELFREYMKKIYGHTSGKFTIINQIDIEILFADTDKSIQILRKYAESAQFDELDKDILRQVEILQENKDQFIDSSTNHSLVFSKIQKRMKQLIIYKSFMQKMSKQLKDSPTLQKYNMQSIGNYLTIIENQACQKDLDLITSFTQIFILLSLLHITLIAFIASTLKYFSIRSQKALSEIQMSKITEVSQEMAGIKSNQ